MKKCSLLALALVMVLLIGAEVNANSLSQGDILVTDFTKKAIIQVDPITGTQTLISSNGLFIRPRGIAIDINGNIFVADDAAFDNRLPNGSGSKGGIIKVDPNTKQQFIVSSNGFFRDPLEIAIDSDGDLIVSDYGTHPYGAILRIDQFLGDQSVVTEGKPFAAFRGIAIESSGDFIISDWGSNSIIRVDALTGLQTTVSSSGFFSSIYGITIKKNGDFLVTDYGVNDSIIRVNPLTGEQAIFASGGYLKEPIGITIDNNGDVLVTDRGTNGIIKINPDTGDQSLVSINGFFTDLWGIAVVPASEPTIDVVLKFFDDSVANETLRGVGKNPWLAKLRLCFMREMLEAAKELIEHEKTNWACFTLKQAFVRCDSENRPPDFVEGKAVEELNDMISELMIELGCE